MSLHNRIDLIDALFQVALIDLGAGPPDCPPDSGGKCSITLVFWAIRRRFLGLISGPEQRTDVRSPSTGEYL